MDENTTQILTEKFNSLPESVKEAIMSSHYQDTLIDIGKKYQMNVDQMGILEREVTLVMMGLTPTKDFETELTRELNFDKLKGSQVVADINEKIFLSIRELLKLMNTPKGEEPSIEETPKEKEDNIMKSAGIEINKSITTPSLLLNKERNMETREDMLKKVENPESANIPDEPLAGWPTGGPSISSSKLAGSFQIPSVKTEYSLDKMSKTSTPASVVSLPAQAGKADLPKIDPYRLAPEE